MSKTDTDFLQEIYQDQDLLESIKIQSFLLDIAIKVKQLRQKRGFSQRILANKIHSTQKTILNLEKGKPVTTETLYKVFKALGVNPVIGFEKTTI